MQTETISSEQAIEALIYQIGDDPTRPGLAETPRLVTEMLGELGKGYAQTEEEVMEGAILEDVHTQGSVKVRDIEFFSLCEHHLLPFFGHCHIAYLPGKKIIGLGRLAAVLEMYARRLQLQERLTEQVADCLWRHLEPRGLSVVIEAQHLCLSMRGHCKSSARLRTEVLRGVLID